MVVETGGALPKSCRRTKENAQRANEKNEKTKVKKSTHQTRTWRWRCCDVCLAPKTFSKTRRNKEGGCGSRKTKRLRRATPLQANRGVSRSLSLGTRSKSKRTPPAAT